MDLLPASNKLEYDNYASNLSETARKTAMKLLSGILVVISLLSFGSCKENAHVKVPSNEARMPSVKSELDPRIPPPDPKKYGYLQDNMTWENPFLVIERNGVSFKAQAASIIEWQHISLDKLTSSLVNLPLTAWPYGKVVAVSEASLGSSNDFKEIKRNKTEAERILKSLGVEINWWPSA